MRLGCSLVFIKQWLVVGGSVEMGWLEAAEAGLQAGKHMLEGEEGSCAVVDLLLERFAAKCLHTKSISNKLRT